MQYIALKELETASGTKMPGDLVPEAKDWDRCWFTTGHVAAYPDEMVPEVRRHMHTGHMQMHGTEFGQSAVGQAFSEARVPAPDILTVREPTVDPALGPAPTGPEAPLGGAGDPMKVESEPKLPEVPTQPVAPHDPLQEQAKAALLPAEADAKAAAQQLPASQPSPEPIVADAQGEVVDPAAPASEAADDAAESADAATDPANPSAPDKPRGRLGRRGRR